MTLPSHAIESAAALTACRPLCQLLCRLPHRDLTHTPYSHWLALYVRAVSSVAQTVRADDGKLATGEASKALAQLRVLVDRMLLSSVFARHWSEVHVPTAAAVGMAGAKDSAAAPRWMDHVAVGDCPIRSADALTTVCEMYTPGFLTDALRGGRLVGCWSTYLRCAAMRTADRNRGVVASDRSATMVHSIIPFSALWRIKAEAHTRPSTSPPQIQTSDCNETRCGALDIPCPTLSLQERDARWTLLQSIGHTVRLQNEMGVAAPPSTASSPPDETNVSMQLHVMLPTEEFDMLCQLSYLRSAMIRDSLTRSRELRALCENVPLRLHYFAECYARASARAHKCGAANTAGGVALGEVGVPAIMCLIASDADCHTLRCRANTSTGDLPRLKTCSMLDTTLLAQFATAAAMPLCGRADETVVHRQAMESCNQWIRRMSTREENMRQLFSHK